MVLVGVSLIPTSFVTLLLVLQEYDMKRRKGLEDSEENNLLSPRAGGVVNFRTCHPVGTMEWRLVEGQEPAPGTRFAKASTNIEGAGGQDDHMHYGGSRYPGLVSDLDRVNFPIPRKTKHKSGPASAKTANRPISRGGTLHKATMEETVPNLPTSDLTTER